MPRFNAPLNILVAICISRWWIYYWHGSGKSRKIIVGKAIKALLSYFQDLRSSNLIGWIKVTRTTWPFQWLHY